MDDINIKLEDFMEQQLPGCVEKVESVPGGFVNFTFRLHLKQELPSVSFDKSTENTLLASIHRLKPKSLIVKIASAFLAGSGKTIPFSVNRQKMEENALKLFNKISIQIDDTQSKSVDLSSVLDRNKTIRVSNVWTRDVVDHILVMDDHGPLQSLTHWALSEKTKSSSTESMVASAKLYGEQIANFLVDMQKSSLPYIKQLESLFRNPELQESMAKLAVGSFEKMRNTHNLVDANEISSIFMRCFQYDGARESTDGQVLSHGDFNAPNFLVDEENSILAIIDWELTRVRSPAHDVAFFLARAQNIMIYNPTNQSMLSFVNGFMDGYREGAKKNDLSWYKNEREKYLFTWYLGVAYGVAMLRWSLTEPCCPPQDGICSHKRSIVTLGSDYIKRCREGPEKSTYDTISQDQFFGRLFHTK
jgi:thiamine kinase-like enzyme